MPILRPFSSPTLTAPVEGEFWLNAIHVSQWEQNHRTKTDEPARSYVQDGAPAPSEFQKQAKLKPKSETDASAFPIARHLHPAASTLSDLSTRAKPPNTTRTHWPASKNLRQSHRCIQTTERPLLTRRRHSAPTQLTSERFRRCLGDFRHAANQLLLDDLRLIGFHFLPSCALLPRAAAAKAPATRTSKFTNINAWALALFHERLSQRQDGKANKDQ